MNFLKHIFFKASIFLFVAVTFLQCAASRNTSVNHFKVLNAWYQSWVIGPVDKGTKIVVELSDVEEGVVFDSIVFREIILPVSTYDVHNTITLTAVLSLENSRMQTTYRKLEGSVNKLFYTYKGESLSIILPAMESKEMNYIR